MTDFTKEELLIMRWYLQKEMPCPPEAHINLMFKIQGMIEDYCEHKNDVNFNALPVKGSPKICKICNEFYI